MNAPIPLRELAAKIPPPWTYEGLCSMSLEEAQARKELIARLSPDVALGIYERIELVRDELEGRYDGAPDSKTLWMAEYMARLEYCLRLLDGKEQP